MSALWAPAIWKSYWNLPKTSVARVFIRTSIKALAPLGKQFSTGSSRSTMGPLAFRSTTLGGTPGLVQLRLEQAVEASEQ